MPTVNAIKKSLRELADPAIAEHSLRFFKTAKGEYGEGDKFLGIRVPVLRKQVRSYRDATLQQAEKLLASSFHEERLFALLLLVYKFKKASDDEKTAIYQLYLDNTRYINNWDLVDSSAYQIVGGYLEDRDRSLLDELVVSSSLWERRIAIVATFQFIRNHDFDDTLRLSKQLLHDKEDLIHKAVGWMLREVGNRDAAVEKAFLKPHYKTMPRTMLRYAIEKFGKEERSDYLQGRV